MGIFPSSGLDPHLQPTSAGVFLPQYITVIRIDSTRKWELAANQAAFAIDQWQDPAVNTEAARLAKALQILKKVASANLPVHLSMADLAPGRPLAEPGIYRFANGKYDQDDFDDWGASTQNEVFIYYDNKDVMLDPANLLSFAPEFGPGNNYPVPPGTPAHPNDSFLFARIVPPAEMSPELKGPLVRVRNYNSTYSNANGQNDGSGVFAPRDPNNPAQRAFYAMNLNFVISGRPRGANPGTAIKLPIVIDPTTGNGNGSEP